MSNPCHFDPLLRSQASRVFRFSEPPTRNRFALEIVAFLACPNSKQQQQQQQDTVTVLWVLCIYHESLPPKVAEKIETNIWHKKNDDSKHLVVLELHFGPFSRMTSILSLKSHHVPVDPRCGFLVRTTKRSCTYFRAGEKSDAIVFSQLKVSWEINSSVFEVVASWVFAQNPCDILVDWFMYLDVPGS